ncbi:MAG TPA: hypothetical protein VKS24_13080 [Bradyrhizobium sp.]|nr:hypothetical protein [Bradyrhizobium sp.]
MRRLFATLLLVLAAGSIAVAQNGIGNPSSGKQGPWPAPVGHRQPRVDQVPSEKNLNNPNDPVNREDAELDRKLKSICRGC